MTTRVSHLAPEDSDCGWTIAEYMELDDDTRYELLEGRLLMTPAPNRHHQGFITRLGTEIQQHVWEHELGICYHAPFDVVLADDTVVQPDFTFISADRVDDLLDDHGAVGAPDLVVEVLSEATGARDRGPKREVYAEAGVEWLVHADPAALLVEVFRLNDEGKYVLEETFEGEDRFYVELFPELEVDLAEIWSPGLME